MSPPIAPPSTRATPLGSATSRPCPTPPPQAGTAPTSTATPAARLPRTKPTPRQPVKERWIVTRKSPTKVSATPTNIDDEKTSDDSAPNHDDVTNRDDEGPKHEDEVPKHDDEVSLSSDENHDDNVPASSDENDVDVPADATAATSTNVVSSPPILFRIVPEPPGTRHDYEKMTRDAARARAEVSSNRP